LEVGVQRTRNLVLAAVVANAITAGATLDQAIKQLSARHQMGVIAFSRYSRAGDLSRGVPWYATIGSTAAGLALAAATTTLRAGGTGRRRALLAATATVGHMLITARAAPLNFSQRSVGDDPAALARIFDRFEALNAVRAGLQVTALAALVGMLPVGGGPGYQSSGLDG
jgi:hypothetical protein